MPMDAVFLHGLTQELTQSLTGARIDKVQQPERDLLLLSVRTQSGNAKLLVHGGVGSARVHFTAGTFENPAEPPMFCMLLRKHLYRGRSKLIASALWLIRLSENSLHLISAVIKLFQRWYGKIRRTHEDYFH